MTTSFDPARWARIEALPLPMGLGNLEHGLCAAARIAYYATGEVTDDLPCVSQVALRFLIALQDRLPYDIRQQLGSVEYRDALLATTPEDDARLVWIAAESARQAALRALGYAGLSDAPETIALRACSTIVDRATADVARSSALVVAEAAYDRSDAAADAALGAAYAASYAASYTHCSYSIFPSTGGYAGAKAAGTAWFAGASTTNPADRAAEWQRAISTFRTLLGLPNEVTP